MIKKHFCSYKNALIYNFDKHCFTTTYVPNVKSMSIICTTASYLDCCFLTLGFKPQGHMLLSLSTSTSNFKNAPKTEHTQWTDAV